jgi:hypothetical protein
MKSLSAAAAILALAISVAEASESLKKVVAAYLEIQTQLAADKIEGVKGPAASIVKDAGAMGTAGTGIVAAAQTLEQAPDLRKAREAFGKLSTAVIDAAKAAGGKDLDGLKLAYCPMARNSWLQKEERLRNPYYGSLMLECGEFRDLSSSKLPHRNRPQ